MGVGGRQQGEVEVVGEEEEGEEGGVGRRMAVEEEVGEGKTATG